MKTTTDVDQKSGTTSDANCIASLVSERREALHAPTGQSSLATNKNLVNKLGECNTSVHTTSPNEEKFTFGAQRGASSDQRCQDVFTEKTRKDVTERFDDVESSDTSSVCSHSSKRHASCKSRISCMVFTQPE